MSNNKSKVAKKKSFIIGWIIPIIAAIGLAFLINKFVVFKIVVPTSSMAPTIEAGDQILVSRIFNDNDLKTGEIVVFKSNYSDELLIKRIIGTPGDVVKITENGDVYINGKLLDQSYVKYPGGKYGEWKVPEGCYFMLGDNRADSYDSRYWANPYIKASSIIAVAGLRIYPFNKIGFLS